MKMPSSVRSSGFTGLLPMPPQMLNPNGCTSWRCTTTERRARGCASWQTVSRIVRPVRLSASTASLCLDAEMSESLTRKIRSPIRSLLDASAGEFVAILEMNTPGLLEEPNGCEQWSIPPTIERPREFLESLTKSTSSTTPSSWVSPNVKSAAYGSFGGVCCCCAVAVLLLAVVAGSEEKEVFVSWEGVVGRMEFCAVEFDGGLDGMSADDDEFCGDIVCFCTCCCCRWMSSSTASARWWMQSTAAWCRCPSMEVPLISRTLSPTLRPARSAAPLGTSLEMNRPGSFS